jgi:OHCU decarboxylase
MKRLDLLNISDQAQAVSIVLPLIEKAPELAKKVASRRPFPTAEHLALAIRQELLGLNEADRIDLFRTHPELAPDNPFEMTNESQREQGRLNLTSNNNAYRERLSDLNKRYTAKFGFPFITALVRHQTMDSVLDEFERRLLRDRQSEIETAVDQIATVSASRVAATFECESAASGLERSQGQANRDTRRDKL